MKKIILTATLLISFMTIYSQNIEKTELNEAELKYLQKDISKGWSSSIPDDDLTNSTINNLVTYQFEIVYGDKVIFRGNVNKPSLSEISFGLNRTKVQFCFSYDILDAETKLELAESKKLKLITTESGIKYYCADFYSLFEKNYKNELIVNDTLANKIHLKFYKLTEK